ncbi:hypothetical protein Tco_0514014 [Tanacetum coccineum]
MRGLLTPVSWLGKHTKSAIAAMAGVWPSNCICKPEPHMLSLYISLFTDDYQKALNPDGFKSCNDGKLLMPYEYEIDNNTMSISKKEKLGFGDVLCHSSGIHVVRCMVTLPMDMHSMRESLSPIKLRLRRRSWKRELWSSGFKLGFVVCDARATGGRMVESQNYSLSATSTGNLHKVPRMWNTASAVNIFEIVNAIWCILLGWDNVESGRMVESQIFSLSATPLANLPQVPMIVDTASAGSV